VDFSGLAPIVIDGSFAERFAHARDLWPRGTLQLVNGVLPAPPDAVAFPTGARQVEHALRWASETGVSIVPWGAGSGVCGAASGESGRLTLDLKRLNRIGPLDTSNRRVRVQAGVLGQHLEDWLEGHGYATRHSPSSIACSTVGGWAVTRSAGQFSSRYGTFADMVHGATVVTPTGMYGAGSLAASTDDAAPGQDAWLATGLPTDHALPWLLGTEGQLGVVTELEVAVHPIAEARALSGWAFDRTEDALASMRQIMQADLRPLALRLYDAVDTRIAGKGTATSTREGASFLKTLVSAVGTIPALRRNALALPLALPRLVNALARGISGRCVLIVGFEGDAGEVAAAETAAAALLGHNGGAALGKAPGEHWYAHRHEVSYKLAPIFAHGGFADTMEVASTWANLPGLYDAVRGALSAHGLVMAHFSHAYREGCSIYFTFAGRGSVDVYDAAWRDALRAAGRAGGTVAHHHGVGLLKQEAAARELAAIAPTFRMLKQALDPRGILNPGRLFPTDREPSVEPGRPAIAIDEISKIATLDAHQSPTEREAWLGERGWRLRHPTARTLAQAAASLPAAARNPAETPILGACVRVDGRRHILPDVPRSAAGPDPRPLFPPDDYETLTVPVDRA
jgi:alkyldihydroxyacetonephosphate synthase